MKVLVLGGCGQQGRAALHALSQNEAVTKIGCADLQPELLTQFEFLDRSKIEVLRSDADDAAALRSLLGSGYDVVIDFLPPHCVRAVAVAAIASGVHLVNTNYATDLMDLDRDARDCRNDHGPRQDQ